MKFLQLLLGLILFAPKLQAQSNSGIVVDNSRTDEVIATGIWNTLSSTTVCYGPTYRNDGNSGKGTKRFQFLPVITQSGTYRVSIMQTNTTSYAPSVPVDIERPGKSPVTVNILRPSTNSWVVLGDYAFTAGPGNKITIRTDGTRGFVMADAFSLKRLDDPEAIVIDNADAAHTSKVGAWTSANIPDGFWLGNFVHDGNTGKGAKTFSFQLTDFPRGLYQVYLRWTEHTNRASNVPVKLISGSGTRSWLINQKENGAAWVIMGGHDLGTGSNGKLTLSNTGSNGYVVADAVMLERKGLVLDNADSQGVTIQGDWTAASDVTGAYDNNLADYPNGRYLHDGNADKAGKWIDYTPEISAAGWYEVFARWSSGMNRASNVSYQFIWPEQTLTVGSWDQRVGGNSWNSLGKYVFDQGHSGKVRLKAAGTTGVVVADAMQFVRIKDGDADGIPDDFELAHGLDMTDPADGALDLDQDGMSNLQEYQQGGDPNNFYSQGSRNIVPVLEIVGGNYQTGPVKAFLPNPLVVRISDSQGNVLEHAPVNYLMVQGEGRLALSGAGAPALDSTLVVRSGADGLARVYFFAPDAGSGGEQKIGATAGSAPSVEFEEMIEEGEIQGLRAWWKLDETSGAALVDSSNLGNSGEISGEAVRVAGVKGQAIQFTAPGQHLAFPSTALLELGTGSFTLSAWFRSAEGDSLDSALLIKSYGSVYFGSGFYLGIGDAGELEFEAYGGGFLNFRSKNSFNDGKWHQVILALDQSLKQARLIVDGVPQNMIRNFDDPEVTVFDFSQLPAIDLTNSEELVAGGKGLGNNNRFLNGELDDLRIYDHALSESEVGQLSDSDRDGLSDAWEIQTFGDLAQTAGENPDGDGKSNLEEYQQGTNPSDPYDNAQRLIILSSGDEQTAEPESWTSEPLVVRILSNAGEAMANVAVHFEVSREEGGLGLLNTGAPAMNKKLEVRSDAQGFARVYYRTPLDEGTKKIVVTAPSSPDEILLSVICYKGARSGGGSGGGGNDGEEQHATPDEAKEAGVPNFGVIMLPISGDAEYAEVLGVNASGEAVGVVGGVGAVTWRDGQMVDLNPLTETDLAWSISDEGKIAVSMDPLLETESEEYQAYESAVFRQTVPIANPYRPYEAVCSVLDINMTGTMVGTVQRKTINTYIATSAYISDGTNITYLDQRPGSWDIRNHDVYYTPGSKAYSVSLNGKSVGSMEFLKTQGVNTPESVGSVAASFVTGAAVALVPVDYSKRKDNDSAAYGVNDAGLTVGYDHNDALLWENGHQVLLGKGVAYSINNQNFIVGITENLGWCLWFKTKDGKWKNVALNDYLAPDSGMTIAYINRITESNVITGAVLKEGKVIPMMLNPSDLAVDANRDGVIKFSGNYNLPDLGDKEEDVTTKERPYRFWINDDDDGTPIDEADHPGSENKDFNDKVITSRRDLEDFSRIWICLNGFQKAVIDGHILVGLKWKNTLDTKPEINVFEHFDDKGGMGYVTNEDSANKEVPNVKLHSVVLNIDQKYQSVTMTEPLIFNKEFWTGVDPGNPFKYLLFEACKEGKGQLVVAFYNQDKVEIGEGRAVWMDLKNIKSMYEQYEALPTSFRAPFDISNSEYPDYTDFAPVLGRPLFKKSYDEEEKAFVLVNGSNESYEYSTLVAETLYKRLFWNGYKGRLVSFRWETLQGPLGGELPAQFNLNEWIAWQLGKSLKKYVESKSFPSGYIKNIGGHSLGCTVVCSALKQNLDADKIVLMQGAIPAGCFDESGGPEDPDSINGYEPMWEKEADNLSPDFAADLGYRGYVSKTAKIKIFSFFNMSDYALFSGPLNVWEGNQERYKPDNLPGLVLKYVFEPNIDPLSQSRLVNKITGALYHNVASPFESMSFVARSRSKALGAVGGVGGIVSENYNVGPGSKTNFSDSRSDHSGEFTRNIQELTEFYKVLNSLIQ